jgi:hypothetical protein
MNWIGMTLTDRFIPIQYLTHIATLFDRKDKSWSLATDFTNCVLVSVILHSPLTTEARSH